MTTIGEEMERLLAEFSRTRNPGAPKIELPQAREPAAPALEAPVNLPKSGLDLGGVTWRPPICNVTKGAHFQVRVLRPDEYEAIRGQAALSAGDGVAHLDVCLLTGARYVELQRLHENPGWFHGNFVHLPAEASLKVKRHQVDRWIRLSDRGGPAVVRFLQVSQLPEMHAFQAQLRRWSTAAVVDPLGLSAKSLRKTWESWLTSVWPERFLLIVQSQGHTKTTSIDHYLNLPFQRDDKVRMMPWLAGWTDDFDPSKVGIGGT